MLEPVQLAWAILALVSGLVFALLLKKAKRSKDKYMMFHVLGVVVLSFLFGWGVYALAYENQHLHWISRLAVFGLGVLNTWFMMRRPWTVRHTFNREEDSVWIEAMFALICGFVGAGAFITAPEVMDVVDFSDDITTINWDLPLVMVLPYFILKAFDSSGQVPFVAIESPFYYTIEEVHPQDWEWVKLQQFNFQIKSSLQADGDLYAWFNKPWVEAPKDKTLQEIFKLVVQERRKRDDLATLQDFGDEYAGKPEFCWTFHLRNPWYNVPGYFRSRRYLNPTSTMEALEVKEHDVIVASRIPAIDHIDPSWLAPADEPVDPNQTVIIQR